MPYEYKCKYGSIHLAIYMNNMCNVLEASELKVNDIKLELCQHSSLFLLAFKSTSGISLNTLYHKYSFGPSFSHFCSIKSAQIPPCSTTQEPLKNEGMCVKSSNQIEKNNLKQAVYNKFSVGVKW